MTTLIWTGITLGAMYTLLALSFNVTLSGAGVLNFAQPQFVMLGALWGYETQSIWGLPLWLGCITAGVVGGGLGFIEERLAIRPLKTNAAHMALVTTVGAAVIIQGAAILIWGTNAQSVNFPGGSTVFHVLGAPILPIDLVLVGLALVATAALHLRIHRTSAGLAERAAVLDPDAARLRGVSVERVATSSFVIAGALAAAVGPLIAVKIGASTEAGDNLIVFGFVALAIGGFGSYFGCLTGGIVVGVLQQFASRYFGNEYPLIILLAILLVVLLVKPTGLLGGRTLRHV